MSEETEVYERMEAERLSKEAAIVAELEIPEEPIVDELPLPEPESSPESILQTLLPAKEAEIKYIDREFSSEESKYIYDQLAEGKFEEVRDLLNEVTKDFAKMNDLDRIREVYKKQYPELDQDEIEDDIREKFHLYNEDDEEYDPKLFKKGLRELKKESTDALKKLEAAKRRIELPKIERGATQATQNADANNEEVSRIRNENTKKWLDSIESGVNGLQDFSFRFDNEEVGFTIEESDKKALSAELKEFNLMNFAEKRGWFKGGENGSMEQYPAVVAKDKYILDNYEKMIKSAYYKGKSEGRIKEVKSIKNIDLGTSQTHQEADLSSDAASFYKALLGNKSTKF